MLPGYNHNIEYQGRTFHIQTEDSGIENPHIISHLFEGGNILETRKCDYTNILDSEQRDKVLMSLMLNQHQALIRELENGKLDEALNGPAPKAPSPVKTKSEEEPLAKPEQAPVAAENALETTKSEESETVEEPVAAEIVSSEPDWLAQLPPPRIIHRQIEAQASTNKSEEEIAALAQSTITQIVEGGSKIALRANSAQDSLDEAMNVILSAVDEDSNSN